MSILDIYSKFHIFSNKSTKCLYKDRNKQQNVFISFQICFKPQHSGDLMNFKPSDYKCSQESMLLTSGFRPGHFSLVPQKGKCLVFNFAISMKVLFSSQSMWWEEEEEELLFKLIRGTAPLFYEQQ